jgi:cytosine/adenosine deaminase-related metal-dependent hydrolase
MAAEAAGLWLVHNPRSNAGNRVGFARNLGASQRVALGTDGYPADMRAERVALVQTAQESGHPLEETVIRARSAGGWALLSERFDEAFAGELAPGIAGDLVVYETSEDASTPGVPPRHVVVAGQVVVEDGRLVHDDIDDIRAYAEVEAPRLWERMAKIG